MKIYVRLIDHTDFVEVEVTDDQYHALVEESVISIVDNYFGENHVSDVSFLPALPTDDSTVLNYCLVESVDDSEEGLLFMIGRTY